MLPASARLAAFVATTDVAKATHFYRDVLGLRLVAEEPYAIVFEWNGTMLRVQKTKELTPHPFTALGWNVDDIEAAFDALVAGGVVFERYPFMAAEGRAIWTAPGGAAQVAWFKDPDGNTLSIAQIP